MGIQNDAILCYGIEFSYVDVVHLKATTEFKQRAEDIGTDNMVNLWSEMGHIYCSNYFDQEEEYLTYIIGKELPNDMTLQEFLNEINEIDIKIYLQKVCKDYNLQYSEPKILCRPNIY
jgi:alpha-D-ribose 1-methylphosphonate 5-triphosphate diphosphatase PhnM